MKLFNYDSPFWSFMSRLADLIILNLLWIVFCIPVVTIGASTTAMYRVTLNMVRGEGSGVVRMFWDAFRLNLKQAVLIFLILLIPVLLVVYEFWMYLSGAVGQSMWLGLVFCCPSLILALVLAYVYPLLAQFDNIADDKNCRRFQICRGNVGSSSTDSSDQSALFRFGAPANDCCRSIGAAPVGDEIFCNISKIFDTHQEN